MNLSTVLEIDKLSRKKYSMYNSMSQVALLCSAEASTDPVPLSRTVAVQGAASGRVLLCCLVDATTKHG
jgi:hypothetical protein